MAQWTKISGSPFTTDSNNQISFSATSLGTYAFKKPEPIPPSKWIDNDKSTWEEANAEGWLGSSNYITGFNGTIDSTSTYNIPKIINNTSIVSVYLSAFINKTFTAIGGKGTTIIDKNAFMNCSFLTEVSFPECKRIYDSAFSSCSSLSEVAFPKCNYIGNEVFAYCSSLTTVSLPICSQIGIQAFLYCRNLTSLYLLSTKVVDLGMYAFTAGSSKLSVYVPASLVSSYKTAWNWSDIASRIVSFNG